MDYCANCGNKELTFVRYIIKGGRTQIRKQCLTCGKVNSMNYKFSLFSDVNKIPLYDSELRLNFYKKSAERREIKKEIGGKEYYNNVYLKSDEWKSKRESILKRDNFKCVCCGGNAEQVHHINYLRVYSENYNDLLSVCKSCHTKIHFGGTVYFNGLKANFGILNNCQNCNKYHNNNNAVLCLICENL